ncbi:hypothetical protein RRF57_008333 [Xylaria bambusicola]|uniref:Uncharacterized protein n=1 Tax=Xylaria bambusicola TaxID=326684 RepID=A0AAN7URX7_9PEZI
MLGLTVQPVSEIERPTKTQSSFSAIHVRQFICRAIPDAAVGAVPLGGPYSRRVTRIALVQAAAWSSSASP